MLKLIPFLTAALGLALTLAFPAGAPAQDLFLTHARIVDPAAEEIREGNLLILEGRIVGSPEEAPADFTGETIDLGGRWVIPGLVDLHTHSYGNAAPGGAADFVGTARVAKRMLYAGVTAFLDLFGPEDGLVSVRARQRSGDLVGADIFASLSCLTATKGHCSEYGQPTRLMDSPEDARRQVSGLAEKKPDVVKIVYAPAGRMPSIDRETLATAIATATELGIKTVIHIQSWEGVRDVVEEGATAITHIPRDPLPPDLPALLAERGVYSIPTLTVQTEFADLVRDPAILEQPLALAVTNEAIRNAYRAEPLPEQAVGWMERNERDRTTVLGAVKVLADAGVTILTGTDSGNWGTIQGYSEHRELVKLVEAGLSPWQALAAATTKAGEFLGRSYGVNAGDEANLVVLEASPIADIHNTQQIFRVIHHGRLVDREGLLER